MELSASMELLAYDDFRTTMNIDHLSSYPSIPPT